VVREVVFVGVDADSELVSDGLAVDSLSSEYSSSATISSALILLTFVMSSDGLSVELERTDITGRHYDSHRF
jgi:hypothetical protein